MCSSPRGDGKASSESSELEPQESCHSPSGHAETQPEEQAAHSPAGASQTAAVHRAQPRPLPAFCLPQRQVQEDHGEQAVQSTQRGALVSSAGGGTARTGCLVAAGTAPRPAAASVLQTAGLAPSVAAGGSTVLPSCDGLKPGGWSTIPGATRATLRGDPAGTASCDERLQTALDR